MNIEFKIYAISLSFVLKTIVYFIFIFKCSKLYILYVCSKFQDAKGVVLKLLE